MTDAILCVASRATEPLNQKYLEIAGRITALFVGTVSVEMIVQGTRSWANKF
jgi:small neutral amino acid transporter SnatA (MarC family)